MWGAGIGAVKNAAVMFRVEQALIFAETKPFYVANQVIALCCQALAAFCSAAPYDITPAFCRHTGAETVRSRAF